MYIVSMTTKTVVVRLEDEDYELLRQRARALGVRPGTAARILLKADLGRETAGREAEERKRKAFEALDRLRELRKGLPPIDLAKLLEEGRQELEERVPRQLGWTE
jgi:Fe2+ transport system protein FeoA